MSVSLTNRRFILWLAAAALLGGLVGRTLNALAPDPDPAECARIAVALTDPESQTARGPRTEAVQAWDNAECEELR